MPDHTLSELDLLVLKSTAFQVEAFARLADTPGKVMAQKASISQSSLHPLPTDVKHHIILISDPDLAYGNNTGIYKWPELGANPYDENNPDNISLPELFTSRDGRLINIPDDITADVLHQLSEDVQKGLRRPSLTEIFETEGGKEWWLKDGGKMPLWIDPTPGSQSTTRLRNRINETGTFQEIKELIQKHESRK